MSELKKQLMVASIQVSPPAGVTVWLTLGNHLDAWIKLATLIYIMGQIIFLVVKGWVLLKKKFSLGGIDGLD